VAGSIEGYDAVREGSDIAGWKVTALAPAKAVVLSSQHPDNLFLDRPSLVAFPSGLLVVACDQTGKGVRDLSGSKGRDDRSRHLLQGRILVSRDHGGSWESVHTFPFCNPCLFRDGQSLYVVGHKGNLQVIRSDDGGVTWRPPADLTSPGTSFAAGPVSAFFDGDSVYLTAMQYNGAGGKGRTAVVLKGTIGTNLASRKNWSISEASKPFNELVSKDSTDNFGVPFFKVPERRHARGERGTRWMTPPDWDNPQLIRVHAEDHYLRDETGGRLHLVASARVHRSNIAVLLEVNQDNSAPTFRVPVAPSGKKLALIPLPGGNLKFCILYDAESQLYWLLSNQITDSMTRTDKLKRHGLPCDQCSRLVLHYSSNLIDWSFAGLIDDSKDDTKPRRCGSMAIHGSDLFIVTSSGDENCRDAGHPNQILFHVVPEFRQLTY